MLLSIFPTFNPGGAQTRFVKLANYFGARLKHIVVAMDGQFGAAERLAGNMDVTCRQVPLNKGRSFENILALRRILNGVAPDMLLTHNWGSMEWAAAKIGLGLYHIHIEDGFGPDEVSRQKTRRVLARRALLRNSDVVVPSRTLERIAKQDWQLRTGCLHFIPNGIDCERFAKQAAIGARERQPGLHVGTVAALRPEKNLPRLLQAFAEVRRNVPCHLTVVGDGSQRSNLEQIAADMGLGRDVTFAGHIADPSQLYGTFDVFALSSDTEQMPYTVLEAMAAGCAIAATDVGDVKEMVSAENKPFVVIRDAQAMAKALSQLLEDGDLRDALGKANQNHVRRHYSEANMFAALAALFRLPE